MKVFCIGRNKTGTTSLEAALKNLGFRMGSQSVGESLIYDWSTRKFDRIIELCRSAQAFQDIPFSLPHTYQAVDASFPGSKFILSVRDSADQWFDSVVRFHSAIIKKGRVPTPDDLKNFKYRHKGWLWNAMKLIYGIDEDSLYDAQIYKAHYNRHNENVVEYFRHRPDDLLVVNLSTEGAEHDLAAFLGKPDAKDFLPHLNKSA